MWVSGGHHSHDVKFSSGDLTSASSCMCGSWYLPIFLFRDGSFTLIHIASLMVLVILWSSLHTKLKLSRDNSWPVMLWWAWTGDGVFMCSVNLSAKVLPDSPNIFFITVYPATPEPVDHSTLWQDDISIFGVYQEVLDGVSSFEKHFYPMFSARCFYSSHPWLGCMGQLCRACCYCQLCWCYWLSHD